MSEKKHTCFFITPIGEKDSEQRRHADMTYHSVVRPAVAEALDCECQRADISFKLGMITDNIVNCVIDSDFAIADISFLNPNVFYELGIRHMAKKPTIHIASVGTKLPFDNIGNHAIFFDPFDWHSQQTAKSNIIDSLKMAKSQKKSDVSNPVVQALNFAKAMESGDEKDKELVQLRSTVEALRQEAQQSGGVAKELLKVARKAKSLDVKTCLVKLYELADGSDSMELTSRVLRRVMADVIWTEEEIDELTRLLMQVDSLTPTVEGMKYLQSRKEIPF